MSNVQYPFTIFYFERPMSNIHLGLPSWTDGGTQTVLLYHWQLIFLCYHIMKIVVTSLVSLAVISKIAISWLYSCDKSSYIRSVYSQCPVDSLKCTEQNVNNQTLIQVSQLYVHVFFCLKVIRSWLNLPIGGHGHVICMGAFDWRSRWIEYYIYP